ncbi:MAG: DUF4097 family beta strand repeat-containing protein, partial [Oscillospiraceae bacterium]|nr:DUF4097 family beta strand repeat-containing protein [Oscillospiraceae bacterium]
MDKITYLAELAEGLARWVPERERQDILRYYAEYFDEAGPGKETEVVQELGDPWALASRLAVEGGYVSQEKANAWTAPKRRKRHYGAAAVVAIVAIVAVAGIVSRVGRLFGFAASRALNQATVVEGVEYQDFGMIMEGGPQVWVEEAEDTGGFWCMEDGTLDWFRAIDAKISIGNIMICGGEDYALFISQNGSLGGYGLDWEVKNGTLKIRDSSADGHLGLDGLGVLLEGSAVDVTITVPCGEHLDELTVKTDVGYVYLNELSVEGDVSAESGTGNVECYEVQTAKKLKLTADVGDIVLGIETLHDGMEMELESDVGNVEASLGCWEVQCAYKVKTDVGTVTVNGRDCGTKAEHKADEAACKLD